MDLGELTRSICATGKRPHRTAALAQLDAIAAAINSLQGTTLKGNQLAYCYEDVNPGSDVNQNALHRVYFRDSRELDTNTTYHRATIIFPEADIEDEVQVSLLSPVLLTADTATYLQTECKPCERDIIHPFRSFQVANVDDHGLTKKEAIPQLLQHHAFYTQDKSPDALNAIFSLDLDKFKSINDTYGHPVGDNYIRAVFRAIKANTQKFGENAAVGHVSGDEFMVAITNTTTAEAHDFINNLKEAIGDPAEFRLYYTQHKRMERAPGRRSQVMADIPTPPVGAKATVGCAFFTFRNWTPASFNRRYETMYNVADEEMYEARGKRT